MSDYLEKGKGVLSVLTNNGHQAYLIGQVVRSIMLDTGYDEIDITTSASIEQIVKNFTQYKYEIINNDTVMLYYEGYLFSISPFKNINDGKFSKKNKRMHYSEILEQDLASRDFTINAIAMSHGGMLTDAFNGYKDLTSGKIRAIGKASKRFKEDPLKIIRAVRLVSELNFKMEISTANAFKRRVKYVNKLSIDFELINELRKLLDGQYLKKAMLYIKDAKLYKYLDFFGYPLKRLSKKYMDCDFAIFAIAAFVYNNRIPDEFENYFSDLDKIRELVELSLLITKENYDTVLLYKYGVDNCLIANKVNRLIGKSKRKDKQIIKLFKNLPIKSRDDMDFKIEDLVKLANGSMSQTINNIYEDMEFKVVTKELLNKYQDLSEYAINELSNLHFDNVNNEVIQNIPINNTKEERIYTFDENESFKQEEIIIEKQIKEFSTQNMPSNEVERSLEEREKILKIREAEIKTLEKNTLKQKLDVEARDLTNQSIEILRSMKYVEYDTVSIESKKELRDTFEKVLVSANPKYGSLKEGNENEED